MARWPDLFLAAGAILAAPASLSAQEGKPSAAPVATASRPPRVQVDPARIIAAMEVCRRTPAERAEAFRYAREQGFGDLPPEIRSGMPFETLVREDVRLRITPGARSLGSSGDCTVYADVRDDYRYEDLVAALTALFGQPGTQEDGERMSWRIDGRYIRAWRFDDGVNIYVGFPALTEAEIASARVEQREREREEIAALTAATAVSPASDIADAAVLCLDANGGTSSLEQSGWARGAGGMAAYTRPGSNVRIFAGGPQCVVDAYGSDSFEQIRDAIQARLRARFGGSVRMRGAVGNAGSFSRGQGFTVGERLGILSSEQRPNGLSIRFTVMTLR